MKTKSEDKEAAKQAPKLKDLTVKSNPKGGTAAKKTPSAGSGLGTGLGAGKAEFDF